MQIKASWKITCILILICFTVPLIGYGQEKSNKQNVQFDFPPLMESIRFKDDITFCGIKIPIK